MSEWIRAQQQVWRKQRLLACLLYSFTAAHTPAAINIAALDPSGELSWSNSVAPGIVTIEASTSAGSPNWLPLPNVYSLSTTGATHVTPEGASQFYRLQAVEISPNPAGFTNLIQAYGVLETLAGDGIGRTDGVSYWQPQFEGGPGVYASLSRPHFAMADRAGNIFIVDKNSHSVLRLETNGTIHTHAGTHFGGFNGDGPAMATSLDLNFPNALWVRSDGTAYVLDTDNGRVRRMATNGIMSTLFLADPNGNPISGGRMLWVKDDESVAYFGNATRIRQWTSTNGLQTLSSGFKELGEFCVESSGDLIVADRGDNYVYRVHPNGTRTLLAGNGSTTGGGDGFPALQTGLYGPRGVWPVPSGGYLLLLHDGCQLWYLDTAGTLRLLLNGAGGNTHGGDGDYFYDPTALKMSEGRSVTMDYQGNIVICDSDYGYIRRIRFQRMEY